MNSIRIPSEILKKFELMLFLAGHGTAKYSRCFFCEKHENSGIGFRHIALIKYQAAKLGYETVWLDQID